MIKHVIKTFFSLTILLVGFSQVTSLYKTIDITEKQPYFIQYKKISLKQKEAIVNNSIQLSLRNNSPHIQLSCWEFWCFFSRDTNIEIQDEWFIIIKSNKKEWIIPYSLNFKKSLTKSEKIFTFLSNKNVSSWLDISKRMQHKSIQKRTLSCEIAASADILSYLMGTEITEDYLLNELPKSQFNTLPNKKWNQLYWGNPQEWFVWYIDKLPNWTKARQRKFTGYGILEKPIEKIINKYGFKTKIISQENYSPEFTQQEHLSTILNELENWNMIQLWWDICTNPKFFNWKENPCMFEWKANWDDSRKISWHYTDINWKEKKYVWLNGEHAYYLLGYKWNIKDPSHIIIWDTYTWKHTYPTSEWMRKWKKMQYRSIIVYAS